MYLHIGGDTAISLDDLIAIIDLEVGLKKEATKEFLNFAGEEQAVVHIGETERSAVITRHGIYYSPISTATLWKRVERLGSRDGYPLLEKNML